MKSIVKILKYQSFDNLRSRWIAGCFLFFAAFTYWIISFTGDASKVIMSMLNVILIIIPLISIIFGTIYMYNNKNYITFMLTQPINRRALYCGLYFGLTIPLITSFVLGTGIPLLFNPEIFYDSIDTLIIIFLTGIFQILVFTAFAFLIATLNEDRLKGLGLSIFIWLFFTALYDGLILFLLQLFQDYPIEKFALGLTIVNPIDLGRILVILKFDVSALMGYTGAVFENFFGKTTGFAVSVTVLLIWFILPFTAGLKKFSKKDI